MKQQRVLVLGAKGRMGRAAVAAFADAGWQVSTLVRPGRARGMPEEHHAIEADAFNAVDVTEAAAGVDVIVNALNVPYEHWARDLPRLTRSVLAAAQASGASVIVPGNVYNYGEAMPELLTEHTPHAAQTKKGRLRCEMEQSYQAAAQRGVQTLILRAGDFIECGKTGNWFDSHIAHRASRGVFVYPGPMDRVHAWAYLPDLARAMVGLAQQRSSLGRFEEFGFEGFSLTGEELAVGVGRATGIPQRVKRFPWAMLKLLAVFSPRMHEVLEMEYLWRVPHRLDGSKLARVLGDFHATPLDVALRDALADALGQGFDQAA
jgi:nucleoside-diphosphate-sugar epimerase